MKPKQKVHVQQVNKDAKTHEYYVVSLENRLSPPIGEYISSRQVQDLIMGGVNVFIKKHEPK